MQKLTSNHSCLFSIYVPSAVQAKITRLEPLPIVGGANKVAELFHESLADHAAINGRCEAIFLVFLTEIIVTRGI